MAECIPDRLPLRASRGERITYNVLKKLPDDYLVYYEPNINSLHPDFIVIAPDLGVVVIEVKGWHLNKILRANDDCIVINDNNCEKIEPNPLKQAWNYQWTLVRRCDRNPKKSILLENDGLYKNKFIFPFWHFAVLSNISQDDLEQCADGSLFSIFRPENTMYENELIGLEGASSEEIRNTLIKYFHPSWKFTPLSIEQVDVLRSIIHPEIILSYLPSKPLTSIESEQCFALVVLDRRQENNCRRIGEGHRIIYGVAGSGKTVLLIARSKWLHDRDPESKILLLCYNVTLGVYLKHVLKNYPRVHVFHFHKWAKHNGIHWLKKDPSTGKKETDENLGKRLLNHLKNQMDGYHKYDAILIDEAQDFPPVWFSCILEALSNPLEGDLLVVCDGNQGIRLIDSVSWKSLGIKAQGRTIHRAFDLDRNYRNTREILQLASHFTTKSLPENEDSISIVPVFPDQAIRRGPPPIILKCKDRVDECQRIINISKIFLEGSAPFNDITMKVNPEHIGILYRMLTSKDKSTFEEFLKELKTISPVTWLNKDPYSRTKVFEQTIKVQTVDSAKGLQYKVVFVMWADLFDPRNPANMDQETRRLYVALTRPEDVLIITYSKPSVFIERMIESGDSVVK